jgi:MFS family permease
VGITSGDLSSGILSQVFKSRKKILLAFMALAILSTALHFSQLYQSAQIYATSFLMGLGCGYLSVFVTTTSEQFGTNLRVTATATVTNFMRGAVTVLIPLRIFIQDLGGFSITVSLIITGIIVWTLAIIALLWLPETYGRDLDFVEE